MLGCFVEVTASQQTPPVLCARKAVCEQLRFRRGVNRGDVEKEWTTKTVLAMLLVLAPILGFPRLRRC